MISLLAALLFVLGFGFLFAAALGLIRFSDPLQRMHAATKAGTVGAGFTVLGAILALGDVEAALIGGGTLVFLLLTVPVAGHLLGRATYVSGADLKLEAGRDAMRNVVHREAEPLDDRLVREPDRPGS